MISPDFRDRLTPEQRARVRAVKLEVGPWNEADVAEAIDLLTPQALDGLGLTPDGRRALGVALCCALTVLDLAQDRERWPEVIR